ncbi:GntR family transcriptional regulator [Actinoplanes sp. NPDC023936]|uniref:GntR family transcriptional regulator n=1 Tax=Actinoplanes sp. NPDC023936 TaxID=3154910 RepID=UPI0033F8593F
MTLSADELAAIYRKRILAGELQAGDKLPTLVELQKEHDVGKGAAQLAIGKLRTEGLVEARRGSGVYVRAREQRVNLSNNWADAVERRGDQAWRVSHLRVDVVPAPELIAEEFGLREGDRVALRHAVVEFEGKPAHVEWVYYPAELAKAADIVFHGTGEGGVYARLEEAGAPVDRYTERFVARAAEESDASTLGLRVGDPVLAVVRVTWSGERVVEVGRAVLNAALYQVEHDSRLEPGR